MAGQPKRHQSGRAQDHRSAAGRDRGGTQPPRREEPPPPTGPHRPLYNGTADAKFTPGTSNSGLWYDKFCNRWESDWSGFGDSGKRDWIKQIANVGDSPSSKKVGDGKLMAEAAERCETLVKALQGECFRRTTAWRFVSGLGRSHPVENGFAWRHETGAPYLPGSSLKGLARAYARDWMPKEQLPKDHLHGIFGPDTEADLAVGSTVFLDALPVEPVVLEVDVMTPHYAPWYQDGAVPGDWHSPTPIPFLTVAPGQTFLFAVLPRNPASAEDREHCKIAADLLGKALETLGAGAKTAAGYGQFIAQDDGTAKAAPRVTTAAAPQPGRRENWAGREAFVHDEPALIIEDRGKTLLVRFQDGVEDEVERREAKLR